MTRPTSGDVMTADELLYLSMPDKQVELVRGRLIVREPPGFRHGVTAMAVAIAGEVLNKVGDWLSAGTRLAWVIDPVRRGGLVYRPDGSVSLLGEHDVLDGEDILPGFACALADVL